MSWARCKICNNEYHWHARRGSKLIDNRCPKCGGEGTASIKEPRKPRLVKPCPICNKGGLQWQKQLISGNSCSEAYYGAMWCPRCKQWIKPVNKQLTN